VSEDGEILLPDNNFGSLYLGSIKRSKFGGKDAYDLAVGNHLVRGKMTKLDHPLLFTEKVGEGSDISFDVKGIITSKIVFSNRPTPLRHAQMAGN